MIWVPTYRLLAVIDKHPDRVKHLGEASSRRIRLLRAGGQEFISLDSADKILTQLDLLHYWHIHMADGGLADIYEHGRQYGKPDNLRGVATGQFPRKYATEEERLEARRATWRRRYQRRMGRAA